MDKRKILKLEVSVVVASILCIFFSIEKSNAWGILFGVIFGVIGCLCVIATADLMAQENKNTLEETRNIKRATQLIAEIPPLFAHLQEWVKFTKNLPIDSLLDKIPLPHGCTGDEDWPNSNYQSKLYSSSSTCTLHYFKFFDDEGHYRHLSPPEHNTIELMKIKKHIQAECHSIQVKYNAYTNLKTLHQS